MRKLSVCLFYGLCVFTIVFSLFWMALPKLPLSQSPAGSETDPASPLSLAAQAVPQTDTARYCLQDSGGRVAVYTCRADGTPGTLIRVTGIYTNLLPENDALRIKGLWSTAPGSWTCCWRIWGSKCNEPLHDVQRLVAFI